MSNGQDGRLTKNERREQAREEARRAREAAKRKERTGRMLLQGGIIVAVIAAVAVIALIIVNSVGPKGPGPENMASGGIVFESNGSGDVQVARTAGLADGAERVPADTGAEIQIQAFVDFFCPICSRFEIGITPQEFAASGLPGTAADYVGSADYIHTLIEEGVASFEVVPVAILDRFSLGTKYSTRSANALACVAENSPNAAYDFMLGLYENQPAEGTSGLDDNEIIAIARDAGAASADTELCIRNQSHKSFITDNTNTAMSRTEFVNLVNDPTFEGLGTPMVYINGQRFTPQYDWSHLPSLRTFIQELQSEEFQETMMQTPTPTPTATPAP